MHACMHARTRSGRSRSMQRRMRNLVLLAGVAERRHGQRAWSTTSAAAVRLVDDAGSDDDGEAQGRRRRQEQQRQRDGSSAHAAS